MNAEDKDMCETRKAVSRYRWLVFAIVLIVQASLVGARELSVQIAMQVLIEANAVEFGGGEQFFEPTTVLAVKLLLRSPQAGEIFHEVYRRSFGAPGKVYALIALERMGDPDFESLRKDFLASDLKPVNYINGCMATDGVKPREYLEGWLQFARTYRGFSEETPIK